MAELPEYMIGNESFSLFSESINVSSAGPIDGDVSAFVLASFILVWIKLVLIASLNVAVIVTILKYKTRSRIYFLLLNMAIADLITGFIDTLPHAIERSAGFHDNSMYWISGDFGNVTCKLQRYLASVSMTASNYILAATSIDRALIVAKPSINFRKGDMYKKCIIMVCWMLSAAVSSPIIILIHNKLLRGGSICGIWFDGNITLKWQLLVIYLFGSMVALPLIIIVVSSTVLVVSIYRGSQSLQYSNSLDYAQLYCHGILRSKLRSFKMTAGVVLGFIVSWFIFFIVLFLQVFGHYHGLWMMIFVTFYYWNCIANPIVFFIFHRRRGRSLSSTDSYVSESGEEIILSHELVEVATNNTETENCQLTKAMS